MGSLCGNGNVAIFNEIKQFLVLHKVLWHMGCCQENGDHVLMVCNTVHRSVYLPIIKQLKYLIVMDDMILLVPVMLLPM